MSSTRPNVIIGTPCYGGLMSHDYVHSLLKLTSYAPKHGFHVGLWTAAHDSLITRSRNTLVTQFLSTPATHMLFIDADISFDAKQVYDMLAFDEDFVAGMYPLKVIDWGAPAMKRLTTGESFESAPLLYVGTPCTGSEAERRGRFVTGIYSGGGFMMVKRQTIEKMIAAYPESRYVGVHAYSNAKGGESYALFECSIDPETKTYISEDFGFCQKWRDIGGKIWLDTEGKLTHIGAFNFVGQPQMRFFQTTALQAAS